MEKTKKYSNDNITADSKKKRPLGKLYKERCSRLLSEYELANANGKPCPIKTNLFGYFV